jgi:hypothetical protein
MLATMIIVTTPSGPPTPRCQEKLEELASHRATGGGAMHRLATAAVLITVLGFGAGCRATTGQSLGTNLNDTGITSEVKRKLAADKMSSLTRVSVDTVNGNVSLSGVVPSAADRARAEEIARQVNGVQQVTNNLQTQKQ